MILWLAKDGVTRFGQLFFWYNIGWFIVDLFLPAGRKGACLMVVCMVKNTVEIFVWRGGELDED